MTVTENLPAGLTLTGVSGTGWACSPTSGNGPLTVTCTHAGPVSAPGSLPPITLTVQVAADAKEVRNCAKVTAVETVVKQTPGGPMDVEVPVPDANPANDEACDVSPVKPTGCVPAPPNMVAWWPLDETSGTTANDLAGFTNNGAHVNGPTPTPGMVAGALHFDGNDDHVRVPDQAELNVGTGNFTLDTWVRTTASQGVVVLLDKRSGPTPLGYSLYLVNGRLGFQMASGSYVNYVEPSGSNRADGNWHHVAAVVDRNNPNTGVRLYVDGVQVFTGQPMSGNLDNTSDLYLGVRTPGMGGGGNLPGDLDEVELFKRALTQQEIQGIFNAGSAGKCKP